MKTTVIQNDNRRAFEIVRSLSAPFITLLVILILSAYITSKVYSDVIMKTFMIVDIMAVVGYFTYTIYTIFYIDKYNIQYDKQAPEWFIRVVKRLRPIHHIICSVSNFVASRLKAIQVYGWVIKLLVNYQENLYKIENWLNAFISSQTGILSVSKANDKKTASANFRKNLSQ